MQKIVLYYFIAINIVSFLVFALDKLKSTKEWRRVSEKTLHTLSFFGGVVGSTLSMFLFHHKTRKKSFLIKHYFIVFMWIVGVFIYFTQLNELTFLEKF